MAKRLIPRHQVGKKLLNLLESFGNAQIAGDSGAGTAMAIASGYQYNPKTKKWEQSKENVKEAEGLRNNLAFLSTFSPTHPATALIEKVTPIISKLFVKNYTNDVIKLLGNLKTSTGQTGPRSKFTKALSDYLQKQGVDVSKLSEMDLINLQAMRQKSMATPKDKRVIIATEFKTPSESVIEYSLREGDYQLGSLSTLVEKGQQHVGTIQRFGSHGVSKDLYDGAIKYGKQQGYKKLVSGEILKSPEQTIYIWNKYYPKRKLLSNSGQHYYNSGLHVKDKDIMNRFVVTDGPVVDLVQASSNIPVKSQNIFHPSMIDRKTWTLKPPNWDNNDVFKIGIPGLLGIIQPNE